MITSWCSRSRLYQGLDWSKPLRDIAGGFKKGAPDRLELQRKFYFESNLLLSAEGMITASVDCFNIRSDWESTIQKPQDGLPPQERNHIHESNTVIAERIYNYFDDVWATQDAHGHKDYEFRMVEGGVGYLNTTHTVLRDLWDIARRNGVMRLQYKGYEVTPVLAEAANAVLNGLPWNEDLGGMNPETDPRLEFFRTMSGSMIPIAFPEAELVGTMFGR